MIVKHSNFYNSTASSGDGGALYSTKSVTTVNCTFINSTAMDGDGGAVYSGEDITALNSTFISSTANRTSHYGGGSGSGGTLYSQQNISVINCTISDSIAGGDGRTANSASCSGWGGAIYGLAVKVTNSTFRSTIARTDGGAVYSTYIQNVIAVNGMPVLVIAQQVMEMVELCTVEVMWRSSTLPYANVQH